MDKNNYKNFLRDEQNLLPENLSWDKVESGIQTKLDLLEASSKKAFWRRIRSFAFLLFGLLISACLINQCYFNKNNSSKKSTEVLNQNHSTIAEKNIQVNTDSPSKKTKILQLEESQKEQTSLAQTDRKNSLSSQTKTNIKKKEAKTFLPNSISTQTIKINKNYSTNRIAQSPIDKFNIKEANESVSGISKFNENQSNQDLVEKNTLNKEISNIKSASPISTLLHFIPTKNKHLGLSGAGPFIKKEAFHPKWSFGLSSGVIFWNPGFEGQMIGQHKAQSEKALVSHGTHFNLSFLLNDKWEISSGLSFANRNSRLEFSGVKDTTVAVDRVVTLVNPDTGNQVGQQSMNLDASAQIYRNLIHHNNYQQWSVPLYLSRNWRSNKRLNLKTGAGIEYAFFGNAKGVTLNLLQGETSVWPSRIKEDDFTLSNRVSVLGNIELEYQLRSKILIKTTIQGSRSISNLDTRIGETFLPSSLYLSAGLTYRL